LNELYKSRKIILKSSDEKGFNSFEELEQYFRGNLPIGIQNIKKKFLLIMDSELTEDNLSEIWSDVHKLAGSAGTFGYDKMNRVLKNLDCYLNDAMRDKTPFNEIDTDFIKKSIDKLTELLNGIDSKNINHSLTDFPVLYGKILEKIPLDWDKSILLFYQKDKSYLRDLEIQLLSFGYKVEHLRDIDKLQNKLVKKENYLIVSDIDVIISNPENIIFFNEIKRSISPLKLVFLSEKNDFTTRITAVKAGGDAFFEIPVDVIRLVDKIYCFEESSLKKPDHVLIVDDDLDAISYYAHLFQQNGMITSVATTPSSVLNLLIESTPDLIMIDLFMPGYNGFELAAMIRQHANFVSIPILILSAFDSPGELIKSYNIVGDDYLNKSVDDRYLLNFVKNKIQRSRDLRYLMERDSLTGLLNHTNFNDNLYRELIRASRTGQPLIYAMIDLDYFKDVNDSYGHLVGDTVLKSLAYLLQERLRKTDIIGRYGGEEFGILLTNTTLNNALSVMNEIRERFSLVRHSVGDSGFYVTFSCGIASFFDYGKAEELSGAADQEVYAARSSGRNRICIANSNSVHAEV
jgi:diguanylate cyclase (GGDEF)-like protein